MRRLDGVLLAIALAMAVLGSLALCAQVYDTLSSGVSAKTATVSIEMGL